MPPTCIKIQRYSSQGCSICKTERVGCVGAGNRGKRMCYDSLPLGEKPDCDTGFKIAFGDEGQGRGKGFNIRFDKNVAHDE